MLYAVLRLEPSPTTYRVWRLVSLAETRQDALEHLDEGDELWLVVRERWIQVSRDDASPPTLEGQMFLF